MFGIGLPEMILILALALIVVGPDKLPDLARSVAKGILELKKTATALKEQLAAENPLDEIKPEIQSAAQSLHENIMNAGASNWKDLQPGEGVNAPAKTAATIIEADLTEIEEIAAEEQASGAAPPSSSPAPPTAS